MESNIVESAIIMTKEELADFYDGISQSYSTRKSSSRDLLLKSKVSLLAAYEEYEMDCVTKYITEKKIIRDRLSFWNDKKCQGCGNKLKFIEYSDSQFWGCPNYRNKDIDHSTFNINAGYYLSEKLERTHVRIKTHWATDVLRNFNLDKIIKSKELIEFYLENGYEDLREKYGYKSTMESISGYINAKRNSKLEEDEITNHLTAIFPNSQVQMGIRYKLLNQVERVAIVDLVLSDDQIVNIVEIKRSTFDIKIDQLKLYHSLINFILRANNNKRKCQAVFLIYNTEVYSFADDTKYIYYDKIREVRSKEELLFIFNTNAQIREN